MTKGIPTFAQGPSPRPPFFKALAVTVLSVLLITWFVLPLFCVSPHLPIQLLLTAPPGIPCATWDRIRSTTTAMDRFRINREPPPILLKGCIQLGPLDPDPRTNPTAYIRPGEAIGILDPSVSQCASGEARSGNDRFFAIVCSPNPETYNGTSWEHEVRHIAAGHSALQHLIKALPEPIDTAAKVALNAFLDTFYVSPYLVFGERWPWYVASLVVFLGALFYLWRGRSHGAVLLHFRM